MIAWWRTALQHPIERLLGPHSFTDSEIDWSDLRKLEPGTEIAMIANGSQPAKRYFLAADDSGVTVLNLTDPTLPAHVRKVLHTLAAQKPTVLTNAPYVGTDLLDKGVRVAQDGVFVADQKVPRWTSKSGN